jgi:16S rRNA (uracil1498-N3)-methyltransferase
VAELWPMSTERSIVKPSDARIEKWSRRAVEAAKQSHRVYVPKIRPYASATEVWARAMEFSAAVICCPRDSPMRNTQEAHGGPVFNRSGDGPDTPHTLFQRPGDEAMSLFDFLRGLGAGATLLACIGPEGGWSEQEVAVAVARGLRPVSLGPNILRIETAAAAVCAIIAQREC